MYRMYLTVYTYIMYNMYMKYRTLSNFRNDIKQAFDHAQWKGPVTISRHGIEFTLYVRNAKGGLVTRLPKETKEIQKPFQVKPGEIHEMPVVKASQAPRTSEGPIKAIPAREKHPDSPIPNPFTGEPKICKHGYDANLCKFAKPGKPCK